MDIDKFLPEILVIKESCYLIGLEENLAIANQKDTTFSCEPSPCKISYDINWIIPEILMIKKFYNLIEWEAHVATPNPKSQMLHSLNDHLHARD